jgi:hypothetical protein
MGRRISDISKDLCDHLVDEIKTSYFALQVDEATEIVKDAHLINYIPFCTGKKYQYSYRGTYLRLVPRSKNEWSYTSTPPIRLHGVVLS